MITILAVFLQLAFSHVHCAPGSSHDPEIEHWRLKEVFIRWVSTQERMEHYTRKVKLLRYDNAFRLDTPNDDNDEDRKVIACFKVKHLQAFIDNELYATLQDPHQVIRMTLANQKDSERLTQFFEPTPLECVNF